MVRFERAVRVAAIELFETCNAGAVKCIKLRRRQMSNKAVRIKLSRNPEPEWVTVFAVERVESIKQARRFVPKIDRQEWKTNEVRIELDQSACGWYAQLDAVALYGYEADEDVPRELGEAAELLREYYAKAPLFDDEAEEDDETQLEGMLRSASVST